jgi:hypothetical protein
MTKEKKKDFFFSSYRNKDTGAAVPSGSNKKTHSDYIKVSDRGKRIPFLGYRNLQTKIFKKMA